MATKISKTLSGSGRMGSKVYPNEPTPLHFTKLFTPKASLMPAPATYEPPRRRRGCGTLCCCFCSIVCSLLFTLVFVLGFAALITWLVLRPIHAPSYSLQDVNLKQFSVSPQNNALSADVAYSIRAENSNGKIGFKFGDINLETSYSGQVFGRSAIPAFSQGHRSVTTLTSELAVKNFAFVPASVGSSLATDLQRGSVALHARGRTNVRAKVGAITSFAVRLYVDCDFTVQPPTATSPGSVLNKTCRVSR